MKKLGNRILVLLLAAMMLLPADLWTVQAANTQNNGETDGTDKTGNESDEAESDKDDKVATSKEKSQAYSKLYAYSNNLKVIHGLDAAKAKGLDDICYNATNYLEGNSKITVTELEQYIADTQEQLDQYISNQNENEPSSTSEFLIVGDCVPTIKGKSGGKMHIILPIYNIGPVQVSDMLVTPVISSRVEDWPFVIDASGYNKMVDNIPGNGNLEDAYKNRREVSWDLDIREDAPTGYYNLQFEVSYYRNGTMENATLAMYVYIEGTAENGKLDGSESENKGATPRIIVTGFTTNPDTVYAGETFNITIHVQNTSNSTNVSNILFELEAAQEGSDENTTYEAFLPTSGSNSIFMNKIAAGGTADLSIELEAKADLTQKPYVLDLKMEYEDASFNSYTSTGSISIPVKQQSKFEISSFDVLPTAIPVGNEANIMFSIYNTGKTTLYNTQVKFVSDSIEGGDSFIGKIEAGGTGNVDTMVTGVAVSESDIIKVLVSYEDEAGVVTEKEFEARLQVTEEEERDFYEDEEIYEEESQGSNVWGIVVIVILVLVVILVVVLQILKKKKEQKQLEEEYDELEDEDFLSEEDEKE